MRQQRDATKEEEEDEVAVAVTAQKPHMSQS